MARRVLNLGIVRGLRGNTGEYGPFTVFYDKATLKSRQDADAYHILPRSYVVATHLDGCEFQDGSWLSYGEGAKVISISPFPVIDTSAVTQWHQPNQSPARGMWHIIDDEHPSATATEGQYVQNNTIYQVSVTIVGTSGTEKVIYLDAGDIVLVDSSNPAGYTKKGTLQGEGVRLADYPQQYISDKRSIGNISSLTGRGVQSIARVGNRIVLGSGPSDLTGSLSVYHSWREIVADMGGAAPGNYGYRSMTTVGSKVVAGCGNVDGSAILAYDSVTDTMSTITAGIPYKSTWGYQQIAAVGNKAVLGSGKNGMKDLVIYDAVTNTIRGTTNAGGVAQTTWGNNLSYCVAGSKLVITCPVASINYILVYNAANDTIATLATPSAGYWQTSMRNTLQDRYVVIGRSPTTNATGAGTTILIYDAVANTVTPKTMPASNYWDGSAVTCIGTRAFIHQRYVAGATPPANAGVYTTTTGAITAMTAFPVSPAGDVIVNNRYVVGLQVNATSISLFIWDSTNNTVTNKTGVVAIATNGMNIDALACASQAIGDYYLLALAQGEYTLIVRYNTATAVLDYITDNPSDTGGTWVPSYTHVVGSVMLAFPVTTTRSRTVFFDTNSGTLTYRTYTLPMVVADTTRKTYPKAITIDNKVIVSNATGAGATAITILYSRPQVS